MKKIVSCPLTVLSMPCFKLSTSLVNECFQNFSYQEYLIRCLYSIDTPVARSTRELATVCYFHGEDFHYSVYSHSMTHRVSNRCVISICVKCTKMFICLCGIMQIFFLDPCVMCCKKMVWWVQVFWVYPLLDVVQWFYTQTLVGKKCTPLVVLDPLQFFLMMSVPALEVHYFFQEGIKQGLKWS